MLSELSICDFSLKYGLKYIRIRQKLLICLSKHSLKSERLFAVAACFFKDLNINATETPFSNISLSFLVCDGGNSQYFHSYNSKNQGRLYVSTVDAEMFNPHTTDCNINCLTKRLVLQKSSRQEDAVINISNNCVLLVLCG